MINKRKIKQKNISVLLILVMMMGMMVSILPEGVLAYAEGDSSVIEDVYGEDVVEDDIEIDEGEVMTPPNPGMMGVLSEGEYPNVPDSVIHTVIAKIGGENGTEITPTITDYYPQMGDEIWLRIDFSLEADHPYGEGSTLTYELPEPLKGVEGSGQLIQDGEIYATYVLNGEGNVVITFNENIRPNDTGIEIQRGYFGITAKYESTSTDLDHDLILPDRDSGSITIPLKFKPQGGETLTKEVNPKSGKNVQELTWTVWVNTEMKDLETSGETFKDELQNLDPGNTHSYKANSLVVKRYTIDTLGVKTEDTSFSDSSLTGYDSFGPNNSSFSLTLTGKYAYEIVYKTIPGDTEEQSQRLKNNAEFPGASPVNKTATVQYDKPLEKTGKAVTPRGTTEWTIVVNANKRNISANTTVTDTWSEGHQLKDGTFKINDSTILPQGFSVDDTHNDGRGFVLTLPETSDTFTITYTTELSDPHKVISKNTPITNTVIRSDRDDKDPISDRSKTVYYNQNVLSKTYTGPNYQDKTVDWTITVNSAGYNMTDIVITDSFVNKNLKVKDGTFKVYKDNSITPLDSATYSLGYGEVDAGGNFIGGNEKGGFQLTLPGTSQKYRIEYTTDYDIRDEENPGSQEYENKAQIKWKTNSADYTSPWVDSKVNINQEQKSNGYKDGYYNYETKTFHWEVGINYNFDTITSPSFTDTLSESQVVDRNSIKVYPLDLSSGGDKGNIDGKVPLVEGNDYTLTPTVDLANTFTITFNNTIDSPYRIIYTSTTKHDYYEPQNNNHVVENKAILCKGTDKHTSWESDVEVKHSSKLIDKRFKQDGTSALVHWELDINTSQSTLKKPIIKDTIGEDPNNTGNLNQMIYKDSFEIVELYFEEDGPTIKEGTSHSPGDGLYDITFHEEGEDLDGATFTITFNDDIDKAYRVKYDTYFLGSNHDGIENTATLYYGHESDDGDKEKESDGELKASFTHFGGAFSAKGQIKILKKDEDSGEPLSGATFQLWNAEKNGVMIEEVSTDEKGVYTFQTKLGYATYYLIETKAPDFYDITSSNYATRKPVTLNVTLANDGLTITNKKFKQSIELTKRAAHDDNHFLEGVEFKLLMDNGGGSYQLERDNLVTDSSGKLYIDELLPGDYQLIETQTLEHYLLDQTPIEFTITPGQETTISRKMKNHKLADLKIKKIDKADKADKNPLEGAIFTLTDIDDDNHQYTSTVTGADGIATFKDVKYGEYKLTEITTPEGYIGGDEVDVKVEDSVNNKINQNVILETVENEKIHQAVKLTKIGTDNGKTLSGAVFELWNKDDNQIVTANGKNEPVGDNGAVTTNQNGTISINNLKPGNYYFKEITAPEYYVIPEEGYQTDVFEIKENQTTITKVEATNKRGIGKIIIEKVGKVYKSTEEKVLQGVEFILKSIDGLTTKSGTTNENGQIIFEDLPYNTYTIEETKPLDEYVANDEIITVKLDGKDEYGNVVDNIELTKMITNTKKDHRAKLTKYNADKSLKLAGAIYELYKEDENGDYKLVEGIGEEKLTTNEDGLLELELEAGKYQLIEKTAPAGYRLDKTPVEFEIEENQTSATSIEMTNRRRSSGGGGGGGPIDPADPEKEKPEEEKPEEEKTDEEKPDEEKSDEEKPEEEKSDEEKPGEEDSEKPEDPTEPPIIPKEELPEKDPEKPVKEKEDKTPKETPKIIEIDPGDTPKGVGTPPKNGKVTIDEDGNWNYTPDPGFVGRDRFSIVVTHPDGTEEEIFFDIDVETPLGGTGEGEPQVETEVKTLPQTGETSNLALYLLGLLFIGLGIFTNRKKSFNRQEILKI